MPTKPVIFLAFANDREDNARYLRNIPAEYNMIRNTLNLAHDKGLCDVEMLPYSTFQDIKNVFTDEKYRNRIAIFHFSGHADGFQLLLENTEGKNEMAYGKGLIDYFQILKTQNIQKNLRLLFFNGCCTARLGAELKSVIPAVIGTIDSINDEQAKAIAVSFYENLAKQIDIKTAFDLAKAERHVDSNSLRGLYRKNLDIEPIADPWQIYYTEEQIMTWKLETGVNEHYVFNEYLIKTLIPELKDYSQNAQKLLQQVQNIPEWQKKPEIIEYAHNILPLFVGVIGIQITGLMAIGEEPLPLETKLRKYFKQCIQVAKIFLRLLGFVLISKLWDYKKGGSSLQHTEILKDFFETNLDFSLQKKLHFLLQLYQVFTQNNLELPFEEFKVLGECLQEDHSFYQNCQILNDLQDSFEKSTSISSVEIAQAEQSLTQLLACLPFLVRFKMSSIREISYRHTRNAEPYFVHHYLQIDNKKKEDVENLKLDALGFFTEAVLFHKGLDYKNNINLFPFVIDYNAIMLEDLDKIYFFNNVDLNNSLAYVCLADGSKINIELSHIQEKEKELADILKDKEKHKKFNVDNVFLVFQQAKEAILGNNPSAQGLDFQMIDE